jgi:Uncharacterized conserved protein
MIYLRQVLEDEPLPTEGAKKDRVRLDRAALDLATIENPELDVQAVLDRLNDLASRLGDRLRNFNDGRDFVEKARGYLFEELGFHGNQEDYFDPLNSCLNQVLERRTGIPITLSVFYMEIARRLAMPVFGIGLPRHFVVQFDDGNYATQSRSRQGIPRSVHVSPRAVVLPSTVFHTGSTSSNYSLVVLRQFRLPPLQLSCFRCKRQAKNATQCSNSTPRISGRLFQAGTAMSCVIPREGSIRLAAPGASVQRETLPQAVIEMPLRTG